MSIGYLTRAFHWSVAKDRRGWRALINDQYGRCVYMTQPLTSKNEAIERGETIAKIRNYNAGYRA